MDAKFGIMVHWGVYSVTSFAPIGAKKHPGNGSEWYLQRLKRPYRLDEKLLTQQWHTKHYGTRTYYDIANDFTAEGFDADYWADTFKAIGAEYVIAVAKHHDGYCLFDQGHYIENGEKRPWNAVEVGPHRDLLKELEVAVKKRGMLFGIYYSLMEFFQMKGRGYLKYVHDQLTHLVKKYRPFLIWFDGDWVKTYEQWHSAELVARLKKLQPGLLVTSRQGKGTPATAYDINVPKDRYIAKDQPADPTKTPWEPESPDGAQHRWECVTGISLGWGYNRIDHTFKTGQELNTLYTEVREHGGRLTVSVGPTKEGYFLKKELDALQEFARLRGKK